MKPNKILLCILAGCALISVMTVFPSNVLSSEIDSQAQISFQMPEYIPVEQQSINKMKSNQGTLVNAPVASGKYDRQFGYFSTRKEVIPVTTRLPSVGVTYIQSLSYILCSVIIVTMIIISENKRTEKREEL
ncbi:MAG: hypothetical protein LKJ07_05545 [Leuconostoc mesenteroides]|uniref:hypothetical protein n=1 Tax=Leuconostoc mesenteroides TaxID=1245 RepID=UPI000FFE21C8|nr:hypothetical protein [Leuconostoc mesenteroides]MBU7546166.1 hypothetical protein [Leuconostoc mesenteroides]MCH3933491.1 hypothetical protein [Leuconostoc mesenteroides]MCI1878150.1 hypothetical protein [Leuconostoc mesenteroides]MCI1907691.1 hypothetical protein [Leuconostoc mesenteroides]MCV2529907.1 hypothetical protein [Leuconostoc mesenteroides]